MQSTKRGTIIKTMYHHLNNHKELIEGLPTELNCFNLNDSEFIDLDFVGKSLEQVKLRRKDSLVSIQSDRQYSQVNLEQKTFALAHELSSINKQKVQENRYHLGFEVPRDHQDVSRLQLRGVKTVENKMKLVPELDSEVNKIAARPMDRDMRLNLTFEENQKI